MSFTAELRVITDSKSWVPDDQFEQYATDWTDRYGVPPTAVVRPGSTAEVSAIVTLCHQHGASVVPQGGNTGLCGGSVVSAVEANSTAGAVILNMSRLSAVLDVNPSRATITVQAGTTIQAAQEAAADVGMLFAPDWGARGTAQIGGGVATNAGGLNVLRWGTMREQVLGVEVVLPDGRIWDGLRALRKDATGPDLKQLFIGAEGTLGIITAAVFKLHPLPASHQTAFVALPSLEALMPFFLHAKTAGRGMTSAFELLPEEGMRRVLANAPDAHRPLAQATDWYVLLRLSGEDVTDALTELLAGAASTGLITDAAVASTPDQEINLWLLRDEMPSIFTFDERGNRHKFDIALPIDCINEFIREALERVDQIVPGTKTYVFGHVGDGNLHFNIYPGPDADVARFDELSSELEHAVDELTWSLGGTISAEHGIGQAMRARLARQKSDIELDLMQTIKDALDPTGVMNPGKVYPSADQRLEHR